MNESLDAWLEGKYVGRFSESDDRRVRFEYAPDAPQTPISLSLPRDRPHSRMAAKNFLENLLPDQAATRARMAKVYDAASTSTFDLLTKSGGDIAGGLVLVLAGTEPAKGPGYLAGALDSDIADRIAAIKRDPDAWLPADALARFSLGGTQGKFALARVDGEWFWPNAAVPSTHILKPANPTNRKLEQAETAAMQLVNLVGLSGLTKLTAPAAAVLRIEDQSTYIVERFDRLMSTSAQHPFATRLHAEDFAQVSNTSPDDKYGLTARQVLEILAPEDTDNRLAHQFVSQLAYNTMLGNSDAHAKNYSILLRPDSIEMSPMYDVVPIGIYPYDQKLAMRIGGADRPQAVGPHHWRKLATTAKLDPDEVLAIVGGIADGIRANVETAWTELDPDQQSVLREQLLRNTDRFTSLNETKRVQFGAQTSDPDSVLTAPRTLPSAESNQAKPRDLEERYRRFPELRPNVPITEPFQVEPLSDRER